MKGHLPKIFPLVRALPLRRNFLFSEVRRSIPVCGSQIRALKDHGYIQLIQRDRARGSIWIATSKAERIAEKGLPRRNP